MPTTFDKGIEFLLLVAMLLDGGLAKAQLKAIKSNLEGGWVVKKQKKFRLFQVCTFAHLK